MHSALTHADQFQVAKLSLVESHTALVKPQLQQYYNPTGGRQPNSNAYCQGALHTDYSVLAVGALPVLQNKGSNLWPNT